MVDIRVFNGLASRRSSKFGQISINVTMPLWAISGKTRSDIRSDGGTRGVPCVPPAKSYPRTMCQKITRDQRIEGWRAFVELLAKLKPRLVGVMTAALVARLHQGNDAVSRR